MTNNFSLRIGARRTTAAGIAATAAALGFSAWSLAQTAPANGPREAVPRWHALVHATVTTSPGRTVEDATVVLKDGVITSIASGGAPPAGARVWDYTGLNVYAGFIDAYVPVTAPKPDASEPGVHFSPQVVAQRSALDGDGLSDNEKEALRKLGFGAAAISPRNGIFKGQSAVVTLRSAKELASGGGGGRFGGFGGGNQSRPDSPEPFDASVVSPQAYHTVSISGMGFGGGGYPSSAQGAIALMRQTLLDADWYDQSMRVYNEHPEGNEPVQRNDALAALGPNSSAGAPLVFVTANEMHIIRADKVADEFGRQAMAVGSGMEFRRLDAVVETGMPIILPLDFPDAPSVKTQAQAENVDLRTLMEWEQAPTNPRRLVDAGVQVALTSSIIKSRSGFSKNLTKAIDHGLTESDALTMLTTNPANMLGVSDRLGQVAEGYIANLVVTDGDLFAKGTKIRDVWVDGFNYEITAPDGPDFKGTWAMDYGDGHDEGDDLVIGKGNSVTVKTADGKTKAKNVKVDGDRIHFLADAEPLQRGEGMWILNATLEGDTLYGAAVSPDGGTIAWSASRIEEEADDEGDDADADEGDADVDADEDDADEDEDAEDSASDVPEALPTPFGAYGLFEQPAQQDLVIRNATIWTAGPEGVIENGVMVVRNGKIDYVGSRGGANAPSGARVIDAGGRHITPGIIDAHSHTGIGDSFGDVNEMGQAITAEARVFDIINPDDIGWYRQLAGGTTGANQLHGSANPIGGQNSVVKARWGVSHPDDMRLEGAPGGIKFALGENPKRSSGRYPDTRMGVEVMIRDRFEAAQDYAAEWDRYNDLGRRAKDSTMPPRRDLELEAIVEIINGDRLVHSHSYRQDEILMLCRVADDFDFKIGTFQHVLEGYKVAEAVKNSAIGASMFSDWWAYKFEVYDAIPYNGSIMHDVGVPVTFNSDSGELARHLNTEATKAVKYGDVDPHEALKFVTYNAALQLGVEDKVGSLQNGLDADFVIWNGDPLATTSRPDSTFVDGRELFSIEKDQELRDWAQAERSRLLQKLYKSGGKSASGNGGPPAGMRGRPTIFAGDLSDEDATAYEGYMLEVYRSGRNPAWDRVCECGVLDFHNN